MSASGQPQLVWRVLMSPHLDIDACKTKLIFVHTGSLYVATYPHNDKRCTMPLLSCTEASLLGLSDRGLVCLTVLGIKPIITPV